MPVLKKAFFLRVSIFTKPSQIGIIISTLEIREPRLREAE